MIASISVWRNVCFMCVCIIPNEGWFIHDVVDQWINNTLVRVGNDITFVLSETEPQLLSLKLWFIYLVFLYQST